MTLRNDDVILTSLKTAVFGSVSGAGPELGVCGP